MKRFPLILLGCFAGAGVALAIGLAVTSSPPSGLAAGEAAGASLAQLPPPERQAPPDRPSATSHEERPGEAISPARPGEAISPARPGEATAPAPPAVREASASAAAVGGPQLDSPLAPPPLLARPAVVPPLFRISTVITPPLAPPTAGPLVLDWPRLGLPRDIRPRPAYSQQALPELDDPALQQALKNMQQQVAAPAGQAEASSSAAATGSEPAAGGSPASPGTLRIVLPDHTQAAADGAALGSAPLPQNSSSASTPEKTAAEPVAAPAPEASAAPNTRPRGSDDRSAPVQLTQITKGEAADRISIHTQNDEVREVLEALAEQGNMSILFTKNVTGKVSATLRDVDVPTAFDAVLKSAGLVARHEKSFLYVGTQEEFDSMAQSLDKLGTRVYRPNYVTAADLQALIHPMLTEKLGVVSVSSPAEVGIPSDATSSTGGNKFAGGDVVLVRDYEAVLAQVDQVVAEIDVRPMQVSIKAVILSVQLNDANSLGINFQFLRDNPNIQFGMGTPPTSLANVSFTNGGLSFGFLDSSLGSFITALETIGDTNVVARPEVMVLNKNRADIHIGQQLGYISTTVTETSTTQSVQFLDVGAQLRLRPFVSSDGLIRMEVHPELSEGSVTTTSGVTLPNKTITQVTTNIMIRDGATVVIGGLLRDDITRTINQLPILGNIPVVGAVFRNTTESTARQEIIVLITPHVVYDCETGAAGAKAACELARNHAVYEEKLNPIGRLAMSRRYLRLAQNAWAAGNCDAARRFVEWAVQYDPSNHAAVELRSQITGDPPPCDLPAATVLAPAAAVPGPAPGSVPTSTGGGQSPPVAGWMLDDLQGRPAAVVEHPLDRGQVGRHVDITKPDKLP